ncbi:MAG: efflux transporter outer membrane subunit [Herminiimonas sp.]|nr:efflux transporter outer membrane subunit [Herminiimonas sp.]
MSALSLAGCASFSGIAPTAVAIEQVSLPNASSQTTVSGAWPEKTWWSVFNDPQLNRLIESALANSPNLATAQSRIARAQASADLNRSASGVQSNATFNPTYGRLSENYQVPKPPIGKGGEFVSQGVATLGFNYDSDLWGKNAALIRSGNALLNATIFDRDAAQLVLTTSIARTYVQLAAQYALQDVLDATRTQRRSISALAAKRVASGLDTRVELKQTESNEAALEVDSAQLATTIDVTRLQLTALTGAMPASAATITRPVMSSAAIGVPPSLPLDLLGRRPELAAQRARIVAAIGDADAAKAQFYPNINLAGLIGFQAIGLGQLLSPSSLLTSVGPAISLPVFDSGRLRANYAIKNADIDTAITQYNQSVVTAAQDVAEQVTRLAALGPEEKASKQATAAAQEAFRLAMLRYKGGLSPYLTVLTIETQLLSQRRIALDIGARRQDLQIGLVRALGGGFSDATLPMANNTR